MTGGLGLNYYCMLGKYDHEVHEDYRMHTLVSCAIMNVTKAATQIKFKEIYIFGLEK